MKYINLFDTQNEMDASIKAIQHGDGPFVFDFVTNTSNPEPTYFDQQHPGGNCVKAKINTTPKDKPTHYSGDTSTGDTAADIVIGTYLYADNNDKLYYSNSVIDSGDYTAIGICVIPNVIETDGSSTSRWCALNYMTCEEGKVETGDPINNYNTKQIGLIWGNYNTNVGASLPSSKLEKSGYEATTDITKLGDGKSNTQKMLDHTENDHVCALKGTPTNTRGIGYSAVALCTALFHTKGTKQGDWYVPAIGELCHFAKNMYGTSSVINIARTKLKYDETNYYSAFACNSYTYWSSSEYDSQDSYSVIVYSSYYNIYYDYDKYDYRRVVPFLSVKN